MKLPLVFTVCAGFILSGPALSGPPEWDRNEFYPAVVIKDYGCAVFWFELSGAATPVAPGLGGVLAPVDGAWVIVDTSHQWPVKDLLWKCNGSLPLGEVTTAWDFMTGEELQVVLATTEELCEGAFKSDPNCHGSKGRGAIKWTGESTGALCEIWTPTGPIATGEFTRITTRNGQISVVCHIRDGE